MEGKMKRKGTGRKSFYQRAEVCPAVFFDARPASFEDVRDILAGVLICGKDISDNLFLRVRYFWKRWVRHFWKKEKDRICSYFAGMLTAALLCFGLSFAGMLLSSQAKEEPAAAPDRYYTSIQIQSGDNLWSIAGRYAKGSGLSIPEYIDELKRINHLAGDGIHAGEYLTIVYFEK